MEETSSSGTRCKNPDCKRTVAQMGSGHRKREYCDDACRQGARRHRLDQARREEVARHWAAFTTETRSFLDWLTTRYSYGKDLADTVELAINREIDRSSAESSAHCEPVLAALREKQLSRVENLKTRILQLEQEGAEREHRLAAASTEQQPRAILSAEQARERARLHGYLDGAYLASTQRLFVSVFQTGQVEPNEMREAIYQERGAADEHLRQRIAELEQELADASQGRDQVQAHFADYVRSTNEKLSELTGKLATLRQEQERAAGQEAHQNIDAYREKLAQASGRIEKLERQVDIQRQQLGQYHQRFYPSSLAVAEQQLMTLGAALNYKILLKYDALAVEVGSGEQAWREFATHANVDELAQAILQAHYLFDNLYALGMVGKRDNQVKPD